MPGESTQHHGEAVAVGASKPDQGLDPRRLLVFQAVGRAGSLAGAARTLGWTQPAVSQHVRRLERDLGLPLVTKVGRSLVLTDPGRVLLQHADAVATRLTAAAEAMADLAGLRTGRVRLAAFPSACATVVSTAITQLTAAVPGLDIRLTQVEPPAALAALAAGEVDIAVVFAYPDSSPGPSAGRPAAVESVPLLEDPLRVVLPLAHPLGARDEVELTDLAGERWIAGCLHCRQHLLRIADRAGFQPDIRHSTDDYVVVQSLVAAGLAAAVLPDLALAASRNPGVLVRPLAGQPPRTVSAVLAPGTHGVPAVAAALDHLRAAAAAQPWDRPGAAGT